MTGRSSGDRVEYQGFILIADITGYTSFLGESELEHAEGTLTDLLELLVDQTRPPLQITGLSGDAVLSYGLDEAVTAQSLIEGLEDAYVAFRRAIELMVLNNTCQCNACANVSSLDLKFFVHHGQFMLSSVGEYTELVGSDVNLVHRLLKNNVTSELGIRAYVLCTDAAERQLAVDTDGVDKLRHVETVDDFGSVITWVRDMHPVYEARKHETLIRYGPEEVLGVYETTVDLPPEVVWDYLNHSGFRELLTGSDRTEVLERSAGRVVEGTVFQCYHGKHTIPQLVLEWRRPTRVVVNMTVPVVGGPIDVLIDFSLDPLGTGTRVTETLARLRGPLPGRVWFRLWVRANKGQDLRRLKSFGQAIEADHSKRPTSDHTLPLISAGEVRAAAAESLRHPPGG